MATYLPIGIYNKNHVQKGCDSFKKINAGYFTPFECQVDSEYPGDDWDGNQTLETLPMKLCFEDLEALDHESLIQKDTLENDVYSYVTGYCDGMKDS